MLVLRVYPQVTPDASLLYLHDTAEDLTLGVVVPQEVPDTKTDDGGGRQDYSSPMG